MSGRAAGGAVEKKNSLRRQLRTFAWPIVAPTIRTAAWFVAPSGVTRTPRLELGLATHPWTTRVMFIYTQRPLESTIVFGDEARAVRVDEDEIRASYVRKTTFRGALPLPTASEAYTLNVARRIGTPSTSFGSLKNIAPCAASWRLCNGTESARRRWRTLFLSVK